MAFKIVDYSYNNLDGRHDRNEQEEQWKRPWIACEVTGDHRLGDSVQYEQCSHLEEVSKQWRPVLDALVGVSYSL